MAAKKYRSYASKRIQKFTWKASVDGGTKNTSISLGTLPGNILITDGYAYVNTQPVGSGTSVSLGYTGATSAFYPSTAVSALSSGKVLKFIPGVLVIGDGQAIGTVDTVAEVIAATRTGSDFGGIVLTAPKEVLMAISNNTDLSAGEITIFIEYYVL